VGKLPASHRYNRLPLLLSNPGGIQQELVVQDLPGTKVVKKQTLKTKLVPFPHFSKGIFPPSGMRNFSGSFSDLHSGVTRK